MEQLGYSGVSRSGGQRIKSSIRDDVCTHVHSLINHSLPRVDTQGYCVIAISAERDPASASEVTQIVLLVSTSLRRLGAVLFKLAHNFR
jgi:hypothetical protein